METKKYDVLVIGAGPAGASAAAEVARRNLRVLMVERKKIVGRPVQCAEYIPDPIVNKLNLGRESIVQKVRGMKTFLSNREIQEALSPGFMINRDTFDQSLVDGACSHGADILLSTKALSRTGNEVIVKSKNAPPSKIIASIIIGADGPLSTVGRWIDTVNQNLMAAVQVRVPLKHRLDFTEVYFDESIYGGYGWLFPKGNQANLGLAMKRKENKPPPLRQILDHFISQHVEEGKIEKKSSGLVTGWIPAEPLRKITKENILLTGDAAGHTHPITGAGIFPAIIFGRRAGKWASRALASHDLTLLNRYEREYLDLIGDTMQKAFIRRQFMEENWEQLDKILKFCWVAFDEYYSEVNFKP